MLVRSLILMLLTAAVSSTAVADPVAAVRRTWLERVAITAADQSCNLFSDGERLALLSGLYQTEGELLRARVAPSEMRRLASEARAHAKSLGCAHPEVISVVETVRNSYQAFAKTNYIEYPGKHSVWGASRAPGERWAVSQTDKESSVVFGLRRQPAQPDDLRVAMAMPGKGQVPSSVQIVIRDTAQMPEPWFGTFSKPGDSMLAPPRAISHVEWAGKVASAKDASGETIWVFTFSPEVTHLIEKLDPREAVQLIIIPSNRATDQAAKRLLFEVGDLRAARAFAMIPRPEGARRTAAGR